MKNLLPRRHGLAFFVSVEELSDPSLVGKAVVVGGQATNAAWFPPPLMPRASSESTPPCRSELPIACALRPFSGWTSGTISGLLAESLHGAQELLTASGKASVDEAYLDVTGTELLHGPPLRAETRPQRVKKDTGLELFHRYRRSTDGRQGRSDQAKPNGVLWVLPGEEARFLAPLDIRRFRA